jgi:cytochrome c-type biogenesis protein CcmH/NrfF
MKALPLSMLLIATAPLLGGLAATGSAPQAASHVFHLAAASVLHAQEAPAPATRARVIEETELDRQTRALASQLRCVVCQGLSVEDSPSQLAQEMRALVREQLEAGRTQAEVKQFFVEKYGEWVLLEPDPSGFNLIVYVLPVLMLIGGAGFVYVTARRMVRPAGAAQTDTAGGEATRDEAGVR